MLEVWIAVTVLICVTAAALLVWVGVIGLALRAWVAITSLLEWHRRRGPRA